MWIQDVESNKFNLCKYDDNNSRGTIIEADVECPKEL